MKRLFTLIIINLLLYNTVFANPAKRDEAGREDDTMKISITIDNGKSTNKISATLENNSSGQAFYKALQKGAITVQMHDYGSFEKVGSLGQSFPRNDQQITTSAGDIILYQGNNIVIYYDKNSWSFTRLGRVEGLSQTELKAILGGGDCRAVFEVSRN